MSHSPLPWVVNADGDTVVSDHPEADEIVCNTAGRKIDAAFFSDEPDRCEDNAKLIVTAVNNHDKLFKALAALVEWNANMGFYDARVWQEASTLLHQIRDEREGEQPGKIVFGLSQPTKQPSPGAAGAALRALRTVADVIDAGDAEALDSAEGEILDAITLLEGGTIEGVNGPKNPAKVLVEVRGGAVEHSSSGNVDVYVIDYDSEPDAEIPEEFQGL